MSRYRSSAAAQAPALPGSPQPAFPGLRERNKIERRQRIEEAARAVFVEKGFDGATIREIAARANVGVGTLFSYSRDKRDLLMMVFNEGLDAITDDAFRTLPTGTTLLAQLLHVFRPRYEFWGRDTDLSRHAVQESFALLTESPTSRTETSRFVARRDRMISGIAKIIEDKQRIGVIAKATDPKLAARLVLNIFLSETRAWLAQPKPTVKEGIQRLAAVLSLAISGISADADESKPNRPGKPSRTRSGRKR
jgi:AcrR family transcriptional regulator